MERQAATGELPRDWRRRRRMIQLDLAAGAGVSTRHGWQWWAKAHPTAGVGAARALPLKLYSE
ncbi:hypothetical protein [Pseudoxanthomonas wuyuanensis]